jgi:hypothetical protein
LIDQKRLNWFDRLPAAAEKAVTPEVWQRSRISSGMMVRFKTDATSIDVDYKLRSEILSFPHMAASGVSGVDLYARDLAGKWRWVETTKPKMQAVKWEVIKGLSPEWREYAIYLPLYNGVDSFEIGVPKGARFEGMPPRLHPVVFYGTSITQGACASRAGMTYAAILGRRLDRPMVNLGFAGYGRMDEAVGVFLGQIDAALYVIDCLANMGPEEVAAKCAPLVLQLRAARPATPIVLVEDCRSPNAWIVPRFAKHLDENHAALRSAFEILRKQGVKNLYYIPGDHLYGDDSEGSIDNLHATDLGFMRQSDVMEPILRQALNQ